MADVRFLKSELVITQPWVEAILSKFGVEIVLDIAKRVLSLKRKPGLIFNSMAAIFTLLKIDMTS